jgi:tellurite resistance protein
MPQPMNALSTLATALREAVAKIHAASRVIVRGEDEASTWVHRFIQREIESRARTRGPAYWDEQFPGLPPPARAERRIRRMLARATVAGVAAAAGASTSELLSLTAKGTAIPLAIPLGLASVGAELAYTTALRIDLAFDLASIYGVPFARDDVGEISTLLAMALDVELVKEPTRHDKPAAPGETKPWRVVRQMQRDDFARQVGSELLQQSVLRNAVPVAGVLVSAAWNQVALRRYARHVHAAIRQRVAIVHACAGVRLGPPGAARAILDGAWLVATADGDLRHHEALALATLIDSLPLPERIVVHEASFCDDEEVWFARLAELEPSARDTLVDVLALVASADGDLSVPERRFLRRLGRALDRALDLGAIEAMAERLRHGEAPPPPSEPAVALEPAGSPS